MNYHNVFLSAAWAHILLNLSKSVVMKKHAHAIQDVDEFE